MKSGILSLDEAPSVRPLRAPAAAPDRRLPVPHHVGLILDGNRRFAREHNLPDPLDAYGLGAEKLDALLAWCRELGIPAVTLWVFSTENFRRSALEVAGVMGTIESKLARLFKDDPTARLGVRVRAVGRLELLPDSTLATIRRRRPRRPPTGR